MKRLAIAALLVLSALGITSTRAAAAGVPHPLSVHPTHSAQPNDYYFYAQSCTGNYSTGSCGYEEAYNSSSAAVGRPTGGYYECDSWTPTQYQDMWLDISNSYSDGYGNVVGTAGVVWPNSVFSNLTGSGTTNYAYYDTNAGSGPVSGSAIGSLKFSPYNSGTYPITGGKITITLRGTISTFSYATYTWSSSQGSMTCSISATGYNSYIEF
jgi:hypothetical protein